MRHFQKRFLSALAVALTASALWLAATDGAGAQSARAGSGINTYAITNARIVTVSGAVIERGTIVIRDGLIVAVGANTAAPPDARDD